jgi:LysM repeat protein
MTLMTQRHIGNLPRHLILAFTLLFCIPGMAETTSESPISLVVDSSIIHCCCPYMGKVISPFGSRGGRKHTGSDIKLQHGDTVSAAMKGVVKMARTYSGYGKLVILTHRDGFETYYSHLSKLLVSVGDTIEAAQPVGLGGRTGRATTNHLHFEVRQHGVAQNPERYFDFATGALKKPLVVGARELVIGSRHQTSKTDGSMADVAQVSDSTVRTADPTYEAPQYVQVQKGDTLYSLSRRHGKTVAELQALNQLKGTLLKIGQQLRVH